MPGAYTTCTAMCGNGAAIGMTSTQAQLKPTLQAQARGLSAFSAAVAGTTARTAAGRLSATSTSQTAAATSVASALFAPSK